MDNKYYGKVVKLDDLSGIIVDFQGEMSFIFSYDNTIDHNIEKGDMVSFIPNYVNTSETTILYATEVKKVNLRIIGK